MYCVYIYNYIYIVYVYIHTWYTDINGIQYRSKYVGGLSKGAGPDKKPLSGKHELLIQIVSLSLF